VGDLARAGAHAQSRRRHSCSRSQSELIRSHSLELWDARVSLVVTFLVHNAHGPISAELNDAHWLEQFELAPNLPVVHGQAVHARARRSATRRWLDWPLHPAAPGFKTWTIGLSLFGIDAIAVLVLSPSVLVWESLTEDLAFRSSCGCRIICAVSGPKAPTPRDRSAPEGSSGGSQSHAARLPRAGRPPPRAAA
jgi:hypothetical protein